MRVIFETPPVPITLNYEGKGKLYKGYGLLRVLLYEPDEQPPLVPGTNITHTNPRKLSDLRAEGGSDGRVVAVPGPSFRDSMGPVVIPESVLAQLPENARLHFGWHFKPGLP